MFKWLTLTNSMYCRVFIVKMMQMCDWIMILAFVSASAALAVNFPCAMSLLTSVVSRST